MHYTPIILTSYDPNIVYTPRIYKPISTVSIARHIISFKTQFTYKKALSLNNAQIINITQMPCTWRKVFKLKLNIKEKFTPGDSIGLIAPNNPNLVDSILTILNIKPSTNYTLTVTGNLEFRFQGSIYDFFLYYFDFRMLPKRRFLYTLIEKSELKNELSYLLCKEGADDYFRLLNNNIIDIIKHFKCHVDLEMLIECCDFIKPRYYSLTNKVGKVCEIIVGILESKDGVYGHFSDFVMRNIAGDVNQENIEIGCMKDNGNYKDILVNRNNSIMAHISNQKVFYENKYYNIRYSKKGDSPSLNSYNENKIVINHNGYNTKHSTNVDFTNLNLDHENKIVINHNGHNTKHCTNVNSTNLNLDHENKSYISYNTEHSTHVNSTNLNLDHENKSYINNNIEFYNKACSVNLRYLMKSNRLMQVKKGKILMIATGTGIAPFFSFMNNDDLTQMWLIYGCRNDCDDLSKDFNIRKNIALSSKNQYVQDLIRNYKDIINGYILEEGNVYICGSINMQKDVLSLMKTYYKFLFAEERIFCDNWS